MSLWHISFFEIETMWTDDQWFSFVERAGERLKRENKGNSGNRGGKAGGGSVSSGGTPQNIIDRINKAKAEKAEREISGD